MINSTWRRRAKGCLQLLAVVLAGLIGTAAAVAVQSRPRDAAQVSYMFLAFGDAGAEGPGLLVVPGERLDRSGIEQESAQKPKGDRWCVVRALDSVSELDPERLKLTPAQVQALDGSRARLGGVDYCVRVGSSCAPGHPTRYTVTLDNKSSYIFRTVYDVSEAGLSHIRYARLGMATFGAAFIVFILAAGIASIILAPLWK